MSEYTIRSNCPPGSDNLFGPRVSVHCRDFDFTFLFEDAILILPPAIIFLLLIPGRIRHLSRHPAQRLFHKSGVFKIACLGALCSLNIVYTIVGNRNERLHTAISTVAGVISTIAIAGALLVSFLDAQRFGASSLLEIYYVILVIIYIPRLRSLWVCPDIYLPRNLWTAQYILTVLVAILESCERKLTPAGSLKSKYLREEALGFWGRGLFVWILPTLRQGYSSILEVSNLPELDPSLGGDEARSRLEKAWSRCRPRYRLLKAIFVAYAREILTCIPPRLIFGGFTFCQPFLIQTAIKLSEQRSSPPTKSYGKALVGAFVLVYLGMAVSKAVYARLVNRIMTMTRAGLMSMIYLCTTKLNNSKLGDSQAITLMGTDVERICNSMQAFHECWISAIEIGVAVYLLERQVGVTCVVPTVVSLVCILGTIPVSKRIVPAQKQWVGRVQQRMTTTLKMLLNMKSIKMLGLTGTFDTMVSNLREVELKTSEIFRKLLICTVTLSNLPADFAPYATFLVYAIISLETQSSSLLADKAFTSLSLISILTGHLLTFIQSLPQFAQCLGCLIRIENYLSETDRGPEKVDGGTSEDSVRHINQLVSPKAHNLSAVHTKAQPEDGVLLSMEGVDISWSLGSDPIFQDLNLTINKGITAIVGPSSSGKSTLVCSIMGDAAIVNGTPHVPLCPVGYCAQLPWILNDTIRHNIIGVNGHFDKNWYTFCLSLAALTSDLEAFPAGDLHLAGTNGGSLSGGQKKRVALARALYSRSPLLILDEVWSGLDSENARLVEENIFGDNGYCRKAGVSVIITAHAVPPFVDHVVVLQGGSIADSGSYEDVISRVPAIARWMTSEMTEVMERMGDKSGVATDDIPVIAGARARPKQTTPSYPTLDPEQDNSRSDGSWSTYRYYINRAGRWKIACFLLCCLSSALFANIVTIWIQRWSEANAKRPHSNPGLYLGVYTVFVILNIGFYVASCYVLIIGIINNTAYALHSDLLKTTLNAPWSFFSSTDSGTIANRFNQDMDLIDMKLPMFAIGFAGGISTIKAYRWQGQFQKTCDEHINTSQRPYYSLLSIQKWLAFVLDLVVAVMAVVLVSIATFFNDKFSPAEIGVGLNLVLTLNDALTQAISSWTQLETSMGAVKRVQQFQDTTPSEHRPWVVTPSLHNWPSRGVIVFDQVTAFYGWNKPPALANINLTIKSKEKLAICGSSGSGKTSLVLALLQMIDVRSGNVSIDGCDLSSLQPSDVRSRINAIPQDPFFVPGTVRFNLSPAMIARDSLIEPALHKVGLWEKISRNGGLDADLQPANWSAGERQLLALARSLTSASPILILDEATSSVDTETERMMQKVIDEEFADRTIIAIVHRFAYIDRFERVAVLQAGKVVECDTPKALLARDSRFRELYSASLEQSL
ncbi:hypothetical protein N7499_010114 [Penicillium canescens]|nr:hypothetical protein N7499_010114 [Penicillium canescens]KAJ6170778.1 hypothetical protein N7485_008124 [Penicillium canescens]